VKQLCDIHIAVDSSYVGQVGQVKHLGSNVDWISAILDSHLGSLPFTYTCQKMDPRWSEGGHVSCCMCKGVFCDSGEKQSRRTPHDCNIERHSAVLRYWSRQLGDGCA
jgi:hypothetical protein